MAACVGALLILGTFVHSADASLYVSARPNAWINVEVLSFDGESIVARIILNVAGNHQNASVHVYGEVFTSMEDKQCSSGICLGTSVRASVGRVVKEVYFSADKNITVFQYAERFASTYQLTNALFGIPIFPFDGHQLNIDITTDFVADIDGHEKVLAFPNGNYEGFYQTVPSQIQEPGLFRYNLTLQIKHPLQFTILMFLSTWVAIGSLMVLTCALVTCRKLRERQTIVAVSSAIIVFLPVFEFSLQGFKSPLGITLPDFFVFIILVANVWLLAQTIIKQKGTRLMTSTPFGDEAPRDHVKETAPQANSTHLAPSRDIQPLRDWLSEQDALKSFDLVYFLLLPVLLFAFQYMRSTQHQLGPVESTMLLLVFPAALFSLPFGVHATFSGSIAGRIRAWAILTLLSGYSIGAAFLTYTASYLAPSLFPLNITVPTPMLVWMSFALGLWWVGMGIGATWMRWIYLTFLRRLPSKAPEIRGALNYPVLRLFRDYTRGSWKLRVSFILVGSFSYVVSLITYWLQHIGWPIP